jgi:FixJ family two-component response regulator
LQDRNLVLVVDDDLGILKGVQRLLRQHAYEPILFSSAEAFKNHTDFKKVVCVILDINLNDGSGIELRHRLKAAGIRVPVIYMTGNEDPAVRKAALDSGCICQSFSELEPTTCACRWSLLGARKEQAYSRG